MNMWAHHSPEFFEEAVIDANRTTEETLGHCNTGMDIACDGRWGFHPLVVALANTGEELGLVHRSGNRPQSSEVV